MFSKKSVFVLIFLFTFIFNPIWSQNKVIDNATPIKVSQYIIDNWTTENGLPSDVLLSIIQTHNHYLWIASFNGLIRFDGAKFTVFNKRNTDVFKSNVIFSLAESPDSTLWIGTQGDGLLSYKKGKFKRVGLDGHSIQRIFIKSNNSIWVGTRGSGIFIFNRKKNIFKQFRIPNFANVSIDVIKKDSSGTIWIGTEGKGIIKYKDNKFTNFFNADLLSDKKVIELFFDNNKNLYIGTYKGLYYFDRHKFKHVSELKNYNINKIVQDKEHNLWIATSVGLFRITNKTHIIEHLNRGKCCENKRILDIIFDHEGSLWLTTYRNGLFRLKKGKFINYTLKQGLASNSIGSLCEYGKNDYLVGSTVGKINRIKNGKISVFNIKTPLPKDRIYNIMRDHKGNIWVSTYKGLLKISKNKKETFYNKKNGLNDDFIRLTYEDHNNNIWIGTRTKGIESFNNDGTITEINKSNGLSSNYIMSINEDKKKNLLVGTVNGGLNVIDKDGKIKVYKKKDGLVSNLIFNTYTDNKGIIWIVTDCGISRFYNGKFINYTSKQGLLKDDIFDFLEDDFGYIWLPTDIGIMRVSKKELNDFAFANTKYINNCRLFDKSDGMKNKQCVGATHSLKASDGTLWIPTLGGVVVVDPKNIHYNLLKPQVHINSFTVDNVPVDIYNPIVIKPNAQRFVFDYSALSFIAPEKVKFKCRLINFDKDWIDVGTNRRQGYTNLSYGDYTFKVIASNNDGVWNKQGAEIKFTVKPFFYETYWFYILVIIGAVGLSWSIYHSNAKRHHRRQTELESLVKERTKKLNENMKALELEIDKRKKIEKELVKAKKNADSANKNKSEFLANMSHEIRTPMNGIIGMTEILSETKLSDKQKENLDIINSSANTLLNVINDILDFSKIEANKLDIEIIDFDIYKNIHNTVKLLHFAAEKKGLYLKEDIENSVPHYVKGDPTRFRQIIMNLCNNAVKFTKKGGVTIKVNNLNENNDSVKLLFKIVDTGVGISEESKNKLFKPFSQANKYTYRKFGGTGLGLVISQKLVKLMGGEIGVESSKDKGSTFWFTAVFQKSNKNKKEFKGKQVANKEPKNKLNILLVDDNIINQKIVTSILNKYEHKIDVAENGKIAVEKFMRNNYDLIFMDIQMPVMNGLEATRHIREIEKKKKLNKVKIVALTANAMKEDKQICLSAGMNDYISKPYKSEDIMRALNV